MTEGGSGVYRGGRWGWRVVGKHRRTAAPPEAGQSGKRQPVFVGRHERQLDPKGRLALPSAFRPRFEPRCYLALGRDGCIDVFTPEAFELMATETMEKVKRGDMGRDEQRALAASTFETSVDAQGRISIDRTLREFAGLELSTKVMVSGSFDRVEIWNAQAYDDVVARGGAALKGA